MSLIVAHDDKIEITGLTKDNAYHSVNLSSYVQTGCEGVLLQFVNNHASLSKAAGFKSGIAIVNRNISIAKNSHQIVLAELGPAYGLTLKCEDSNVDVFIMAEFFEGMVLRNTDNWINLSNVQTGWVTHTITPLGDDTYADIEAVLVVGHKDSGVQPFGARAVGATVEPIYLISDHIFTVPVGTNANGQYQVYIEPAGCGPPSMYGQEIGYIKKGYDFTAVFEPEDLSLDTNSDWEDLDLNSAVADYTTHAVVRLVIDSTSGTDVCGVRAKGSSNPVDLLSFATWAVYWPAVDDNKLVEYQYKGDSTVVFDVWGYVAEEAPPTPPPPPPPAPDLDLVISDRFVVSLGSVLLEILNLNNVTDRDSITTQIQSPEFGLGVVTTDGSSIASAINLSISGRNIIINNSDLDDDSLVLMIFGY